jgi:hypothetical protein
MRTEVLTDLLAKLEECDAGEDAKAEFRKLIQAAGAAHGVDAGGGDERIMFARHLLDLMVPRATIRDRLMSRFTISRAQSYRDISAALKIVSQKWDAGVV